MESAKLKTSALLMQLGATFIIANLIALTGFIFAWPSYTVEMFKSNATVLNEPMTPGQVDVLGSLTNIGALIATPFCSYSVDKFGRKYSAMLFGLPYAISWAILTVTKSVYLVIFAVGLAGFGAAGQAISSVYISEICHDSVRGGLTSMTVSGFFIGLLFSYALGGYLSYHHVIYVHLALSVMYIVLLTLLKESPVFLLKIGKEKEAAESIAFYHRVELNSKELEVEISKIKLQLDPRIDKILEAGNEEAVTAELLDNPPSFTAKVEQQESAWQFLRRSESSKRALMAVLIVMAVTILMGSIVMQVYAETLFKEAVPTMNPNTCSILLALDYMIASILCAFMLDKFGRKSLMTVTAILTGVFSILLGSQLHIPWAPHWFTLFLIYGYSLSYNLGVAVVPYVLTAEVFLPEVRGLCNSFSMACMWFMNFVVLYIFNPLVEACGLGPTFYIFSVVCFIAASYSHFFLPETKGLSADAIQPLFLKKNRTKNPPKV